MEVPSRGAVAPRPAIPRVREERCQGHARCSASDLSAGECPDSVKRHTPPVMTGLVPAMHVFVVCRETDVAGGLFPGELRASVFAAIRALMIDARSAPRLLRHAPFAAFMAAILGCLASAGLCALGITPCVASALAATLLCGQLLITRTDGLFADAFFPALYGGTFAGMTRVVPSGGSAFVHSPIITGLSFILLAVCCGLAFFVVARLDNRSQRPFGSGCGGRLGAIAVMASFLFVMASGDFHAMPPDALDIGSLAAPSRFFACLAGTLATMFAQRRAAAVGVAARIFTASLVALIGLLTIHFAKPDDMLASQAFYAGCFLGMSTPERVSGWTQPVLGALVLTAVLVPVGALLPGVGGGLGLAAFVTVALNQLIARTMIKPVLSAFAPARNSIRRLRCPRFKQLREYRARWLPDAYSESVAQRRARVGTCEIESGESSGVHRDRGNTVLLTGRS